MSQEFQLKKKSRTPWIVASLVALSVIAAGAYFFSARQQDSVAFGTTLKVHFEPAMAGEERIIQFVNEKIAPDYGLKLEAVGLQDPVQANRAVAEG